MILGRLPLGWSEKVTCTDTIAVALSGQAPLKCPDLLQIQQSPVSDSAAPVLGAEGVPVLGLSLLDSPLDFFLHSFSLCPEKRHQLQVMPLSLLSGFFLLLLENLVELNKTVSRPLPHLLTGLLFLGQ